MHATKLAIRTLGRRVLDLEADAHRLDQLIDTLVCRTAPSLLDVHGVGTHTAAILLVAAGDNPHRLHSEAAFAALCAVAPVPASSGKTNRHRLSRGGDAQPTMPCIASRWWASRPTHKRATTSSAKTPTVSSLNLKPEVNSPSGRPIAIPMK